jgi:hypothetical protein
MLFAKDLHRRYFSLDRRLIELLKPFEVSHYCIEFFPGLSHWVFFSKVLRTLLSNLSVLLARRDILVLYASILYILRALLKFALRHPNKQALRMKLLPRIIFQMSTPGIQIYLGYTPFH